MPAVAQPQAAHSSPNRPGLPHQNHPPTGSAPTHQCDPRHTKPLPVPLPTSGRPPQDRIASYSAQLLVHPRSRRGNHHQPSAPHPAPVFSFFAWGGVPDPWPGGHMQGASSATRRSRTARVGSWRFERRQDGVARLSGLRVPARPRRSLTEPHVISRAPCLPTTPTMPAIAPPSLTP